MMCPTSFGVAVQRNRKPNPPEGPAPTQAETKQGLQNPIPASRVLVSLLQNLIKSTQPIIKTSSG